MSLKIFLSVCVIALANSVFLTSWISSCVRYIYCGVQVTENIAGLVQWPFCLIYIITVSPTVITDISSFIKVVNIVSDLIERGIMCVIYRYIVYTICQSIKKPVAWATRLTHLRVVDYDSLSHLNDCSESLRGDHFVSSIFIQHTICF